jgi:hypothetical protein
MLEPPSSSLAILSPFYAARERKALTSGKSPDGRLFLTNLQKKISCPRPAFVQVGPQQVPKFNHLLEQIIDSLKSVIFDGVGNRCVNLSPDERFLTCRATAADCFVEVCTSKWHHAMHQEFVKDHDLEFLLPLIFHR